MQNRYRFIGLVVLLVPVAILALWLAYVGWLSWLTSESRARRIVARAVPLEATYEEVLAAARKLTDRYPQERRGCSGPGVPSSAPRGPAIETFLEERQVFPLPLVVYSHVMWCFDDRGVLAFTLIKSGSDGP